MENTENQINSIEDVNRIFNEQLAIKCFSFEEALRVVYLPIVMTSAAFDYINRALSICVTNRYSYKKESRILRAEMQQYKSDTLWGIGSDILNELLDRKNMLLESASSSLKNLWNIIHRNETKRHPEIDKNRLLLSCNISVALLILRYVLSYQAQTSNLVKERTGRSENYVDEHCVNIFNALVKILGDYRIEKTPMMTISMKALAKKMLKLVDVRFKFENNGKQEKRHQGQ